MSQEDLQALGSAIGMVTESGALAVPEEELVGGDTVTAANTDGTETQPVWTKPGPSLFPAEKQPAGRELHFLLKRDWFLS